jgi:phospholipase C
MADRRQVLTGAAGGVLSSALMGVIEKALAAPSPTGAKGDLTDIEHVVILMQENRSFDHYFGTLRGVRGYDDPHALTLPNGDPVWRQAKPANEGGHVAPFHFDAAATSAENITSLDHSWKGTQARWAHHDVWIPQKGPMSMGHFQRSDIPFYHALADAFTICDAYHASVFGPTNPNRLYLFTGTSGATVGETGPIVVTNPPQEPSERADPAHDNPNWPGLAWTTYAERLEAAGVSWKVYQEYDNYGDNVLAYFARFRGAHIPTALREKGRSWSEGSTPENAKTSNGEHLAAAFRRDLAAGTLPQVSWVVASYRLSEHPQASPALGQAFTAQLIDALADHPEVFAKTVFILNYDENDGFFDHVPPPIPAISPAYGASTVDTAGEVYQGQPMGLGLRVPMIVVSPWTKGGFVNSQLFDHTSVLRLLEARFGVAEPNISPWRRAVCGDLTSVFDFKGRGALPVGLPQTAPLVARAAANQHQPHPVAPEIDQPLPRQEPGQRLARPLPYVLHAHGRVGEDGLTLTLRNTGTAAAVFDLRVVGGATGPWFYTVEAGKTLEATVPLAGAHDLALRGPNGFLRGFKGAGPERIDARLSYEAGLDRVALTLVNGSDRARTLRVAGGLYDHGPARTYRLKPGETARDAWSVAALAHWYDLVVSDPEQPAFGRRFAGHMETGRASLSDPAIGRG